MPCHALSRATPRPDVRVNGAPHLAAVSRTPAPALVDVEALQLPRVPWRSLSALSACTFRVGVLMNTRRTILLLVPLLVASCSSRNSTGGTDAAATGGTDAAATTLDFLARYRAGDRNFAGANLSGVNLSARGFSDVDFTGANLSGANLSYTQFYDVNFTNANLSGANLTNAGLSGANLTGANLTGANLTGANLSGASLNAAVLNGVYCDATTDWPAGFTPPTCRALP